MESSNIFKMTASCWLLSFAILSATILHNNHNAGVSSFAPPSLTAKNSLPRLQQGLFSTTEIVETSSITDSSSDESGASVDMGVGDKVELGSEISQLKPEISTIIKI